MNQDNIWDFFQTQNPSSFRGAMPRLQFLVKKTKRLCPKGKILNIGVGNGLFEREAISCDLDVYSLDPSNKTIEKLRIDLNIGEKAQVGYSQSIPFDEGAFDCVILSEVIEHLNPEIRAASLLEIRRVLMTDGYIIGTVPAREQLKINYVFCPHCEEYFHRWGHVQSFTPLYLKKILTQCFSDVHCVERHFMDWRLPRYASIVKAFIKDLCWRFGIRTAGESIYFLARK